MTNLLIFALNFPVYSEISNSIPSSACPIPNRCVSLNDQQLFQINKKAEDKEPKKRAEEISEKLVSKANDMSINIDSFVATQVANSKSATVAIRPKNSTEKEYIVMTITEEDVSGSKTNVKSPLDLAKQYNEIIKKAINEYRIAHYRNSIKANPFGTLSLVVICFLIILHKEIYAFILSDRGAFIISDRIKRACLTTLKNLGNFRKSFSPNQNDSQSNSEQESSTTKTWKEIQEEFVKGKKLPHGDIIEYIYSINYKYVIYRSKNEIRTYINEDYSKDLDDNSMTSKYNVILQKQAVIFSKQPDKLKDSKSINPIIAKGIELALVGKEEEANIVLDTAIERLDSFNKDHNVFLYLRGSFFTLCNFISVVLILNIMPILFPQWFNNIFDLLDIPQEFFIVIFFGALGGFLSVAYGLRKQNIDIDLGSNIERLAASRIFIAVISSLIIYSALRGDIVGGFSFFVNDNTEIPVFRVAFISAIAGFVERLVPDLLTSKSNHKNDKSKSNGNPTANEQETT